LHRSGPNIVLAAHVEPVEGRRNLAAEAADEPAETVHTDYVSLEKASPEVLEIDGGLEHVDVAAQGAAQARIVEAQAEAEALGLLAAALQDNPQLLQYQYINKLAPGVQTIFVPSGNQFILPLPTAAPTVAP